MPGPRKHSRHTFTTGVITEIEQGDLIHLSDRTPFRFRSRDDNLKHIVNQGDTFHNIAARLYASISARPAGLWWVIADYQPQPVVDPTLLPTPGTTLVAPSVRVVQEEIFATSRRQE